MLKRALGPASITATRSFPPWRSNRGSRSSSSSILPRTGLRAQYLVRVMPARPHRRLVQVHMIPRDCSIHKRGLNWEMLNGCTNGRLKESSTSQRMRSRSQDLEPIRIQMWLTRRRISKKVSYLLLTHQMPVAVLSTSTMCLPAQELMSNKLGSHRFNPQSNHSNSSHK